MIHSEHGEESVQSLICNVTILGNTEIVFTNKKKVGFRPSVHHRVVVGRVLATTGPLISGFLNTQNQLLKKLFPGEKKKSLE